jgi:hypothetical protein
LYPKRACAEAGCQIPLTDAIEIREQIRAQLAAVLKQRDAEQERTRAREPRPSNEALHSPNLLGILRAWLKSLEGLTATVPVPDPRESLARDVEEERLSVGRASGTVR